LAKIHNSNFNRCYTQAACNLRFIFDELFFCDQISALSKSCYHHIRALRCIRPYLYLHTAKTIVTSIVHSKLDNNSTLYYGLWKYRINCIQHLQNVSARTTVNAPTHRPSSLYTGLKFLNELKIIL